MEKVTIQNRKGQNVVVLFEEKENSKGLVIGMHGLGGHKEQSPIKAMAEAFGDNDYDVVRFDATSSFGESDGEYEDATVTNNYEDLEDVIEWCKGQGWFKGPFVLVGHSLGSLCIILYTEKHPGEVKALVPMSSAIAGKFREKREPSESLEKWKKDGIMITTGYDGRIKRLKWSFMEDYYNYDILKEIEKVKVPVLLMVGDRDTSTPLEYQQILYDKLQTKKELHVIKEAPHTFRELEHLEEVKKILNLWIKKLD